MRARELGPGTRAVHAGLPEPRQGEPFLPGPAFAAPFHLAGDVDSAPFGYQRYGNPTWAAYEAALGDLEGGNAVVFASGMAAVAAVLLPALKEGDALVVPSDCYPGVRSIATEHLAPRGVEVRQVATDETEILGALGGAALVWLETPSNPGLDVVDVRRIVDAAHGAGAVVAVDNTLATPLVQRPLDLGAEYSVSSGSKHLSGHSDLVMGHVAVRDGERLEGLRHWRGLTGAIPGPFEVWLAHRSLATLAVRLDRQTANAAALAAALRARDDVTGVRYPGFGTVVCFELAGAADAQAFLASCALVAEATSFGGVHSTAERRARWAKDAVSEGFVRFSAGIEDTADLVTDVLQALDRSRR